MTSEDATVAMSILAKEIRELRERVRKLEGFLERLHEWDMLTAGQESVSDGAYWRQEIERVLNG